MDPSLLIHGSIEKIDRALKNGSDVNRFSKIICVHMIGMNIFIITTTFEFMVLYRTIDDLKDVLKLFDTYKYQKPTLYSLCNILYEKSIYLKRKTVDPKILIERIKIFNEIHKDGYDCIENCKYNTPNLILELALKIDIFYINDRFKFNPDISIYKCIIDEKIISPTVRDRANRLPSWIITANYTKQFKDVFDFVHNTEQQSITLFELILNNLIINRQSFYLDF